MANYFGIVFKDILSPCYDTHHYDYYFKGTINLYINLIIQIN